MTALDLDELERDIAEARAATSPQGWHVVPSKVIEAAPELIRRARNAEKAEREVARLEAFVDGQQMRDEWNAFVEEEYDELDAAEQLYARALLTQVTR